MDDDKIKVYPPLYMVGRKIHCWRCDTKMTVIALLAPKAEDVEDQVCLLSGITEIPKGVLSFIQERVPTFQFRYSKTVGGKYYANTCSKCKVIYGDFFLNDEPGAPFFPEDAEDAKTLYLREIPLSSSVRIAASVGIGVGEMIIENAIKL